MKSFINMKELFCFQNLTIYDILSRQIIFRNTTSVSKRKRKFKEFRGILEKCVYSLFSDYEITEKF